MPSRSGQGLHDPPRCLRSPAVRTLHNMALSIMAQGMNAAFRRDARGVTRGAVDPLRRFDFNRRAARTVGKQPLARSLVAPVAAQCVEQARREQRVAILAALALAYLEAHALRSALDVGKLQGAHLGHAQSCSVGGGEQRAPA